MRRRWPSPRRRRDGDRPRCLGAGRPELSVRLGAAYAAFQRRCPRGCRPRCRPGDRRRPRAGSSSTALGHRRDGEDDADPAPRWWTWPSTRGAALRPPGPPPMPTPRIWPTTWSTTAWPTCPAPFPEPRRSRWSTPTLPYMAKLADLGPMEALRFGRRSAGRLSVCHGAGHRARGGRVAGAPVHSSRGSTRAQPHRSLTESTVRSTRPSARPRRSRSGWCWPSGFRA